MTDVVALEQVMMNSEDEWCSKVVSKGKEGTQMTKGGDNKALQDV